MLPERPEAPAARHENVAFFAKLTRRQLMQPIAPKLRLHGTIMLPLSKLARHKKSVVVSLGVVFRKLNEFQQKLHPCVHTQLLINIVYRLFNGSFGYK